MAGSVAQYGSDARWIGTASCGFRLCQLLLSESHWLNKPTLFNFFSGGVISITDYFGCTLLMFLGWLLGVIGLQKITAAVTSLRLSETWDDFNEARLSKEVTPACIIMQGIISDHRVLGYIELLMGVVNIAFFGCCVLQAAIVLRIFQPLTEKYMVDTLLWNAILFCCTLLYRIALLWRAVDTKKKISVMKRQVTVFPRNDISDLLDIFHDTEFYAGSHEGLLLLSPGFQPEIYPNRQISFELSRIDDELNRLLNASKAELRSLCDTAEEKADIEISRYLVEALIHLVIAFSAGIGFPFNYYYAAASYRWFGDFSSHLIYWSELIRNSTIMTDALIGYFVIEPAVEAVQTYRQKKSKML